MDEMDQDTASVLFREGAVLILQDVSEGMEIGIDYKSWTVGPQFRGIKMIPPGLHFVYFSAGDKDGGQSPRTGFFLHLQKRDITVKKWNKFTEDFDDVDLSEEDLQRYRDNMKEMDRYLGPYPYEHYKKWVSLTSYLPWDQCQRLQPDNGRIASVTDFISTKSDSQSRKKTETQSVQGAQASQQTNQSASTSKCTDVKEPTSLRDAESQLPEMVVNECSVIKFSKIPQKYPEGSSPADITKYNMDSSYALDSMLQTCYQSDENGILGELQFSFVCLLIGQVYDAFDQWKRLVHLLCSSEEALGKHQTLFTNFITVLYFQVQEIPEDFFVDIVSQNNFLTTTLQEFFSNLENRPVRDALRKKGLKFRDHLTQKFKWDFVSEPDDYAPVVVDLGS